METDAYKLFATKQINSINFKEVLSGNKENLTKSNFFVVFILFNKHMS